MMARKVESGGRRRPSASTRRRRIAFRAAAVLGVVLIAAVITEVGFRIREHFNRGWGEGPGGISIPDDRWGWKYSIGKRRLVCPEWDVNIHVNDLYLAGPPYDAQAAATRTRLLALGDSHTFAIGVATEDNWVQALERQLNEQQKSDSFITYNAAIPAYSLQQYLVRLIDQGPVLKPHYVLVGFCYATDLYDMIVGLRQIEFRPGLRMTYFDLDPNGTLVERLWEIPVDSVQKVSNPAAKLRRLLGQFATLRYLRRSSLALFVGSRIRWGGQSLWPNMELVVEREVSEEHKGHWRLVEALLLRIRDECDKLGAHLVVVGIPYVPQVYDEIWKATFEGKEQYSRSAANERMASLLDQHGIEYVDTLEAMRAEVRRTGQWLHFRKDAHPTAEGHTVIARTILNAGVIRIQP